MTAGLVTKPLSKDKWAQLEEINADLTKKFSLQRRELITRGHAIVTSLCSSPRVKVGKCVTIIFEGMADFSFHQNLISPSTTMPWELPEIQLSLALYNSNCYTCI